MTRNEHYFATNFFTLFRSAGSTSASNHGFLRSNNTVRQHGCGSGK